MRTTLSGYFRNLQIDQNKTAKELFDVTKQISSGHKIQYAHEDATVFIDTVRLDNEVTIFTQVKQNSQKALQFSTNSDTAMNQMTEILDAMKVKLISAANAPHSRQGLDAIAGELRGLESNLIQLANTSVDGKYLFSGSAITTKPIDPNGIYQGNGDEIKSFIGSGIEQTYNINGRDLFLGDENHTQRKITTNVTLYSAGTTDYLKGSDSIEDMMGFDTTGATPYYFYVRGTDSNGESFKQRFDVPSPATETVDNLLVKIRDLFGNVNVSIDKVGNIIIQDQMNGSSKIDFHMFGSDVAVADIDDPLLDAGNIKEFIKSDLNFAAGVLPAPITQGEAYDRTQLTRIGSELISNVPQIVKQGVLDADGNDISNKTALDDTQLHQVFSGITYDAQGKYVSGLDSKVLSLVGNNSVTGTPYTASINLLDAGSTFTYNGTDYNIYNAENPQTVVNAGDMTYKQLMDVVNMVITNSPPGAAPGAAADYNAAIVSAELSGMTSLSYDGKITFKDLSPNNSPTAATMSMYDSTTDAGFTIGKTTGSIGTFNTNNTLTVSDPKTDFFRQINEAITSVELGRIRPDGNGNDPRNNGVENAIQAIDDLAGHLYSQHAIAGIHSQTFERTIERTDMLIVTTKTLRSETLDVDIADASLELKQLQLNYQAMLSSVSKISQLSLVNYL